MFWAMQSGRALRRNEESSFEYSAMLGFYDSNEEGNIMRTLQSALQLVS